LSRTISVDPRDQPVEVGDILRSFVDVTIRGRDDLRHDPPALTDDLLRGTAKRSGKSFSS
jgi:hypothetical protein